MSSKPTPPPGSVHLILFRCENEDVFYLEIPIHILITLCISPLKYLRYLGWCVLGVEGTLVDEQGNKAPLSGALTDQGIYQYIVPGENPLAHAVDLEVIKEKTQVLSETGTESSDFFSSDLPRRDGVCVFSGLPGVGMYIIPYQRGDEVHSLFLFGMQANSMGCFSGFNLSSITAHTARTSIHSQLMIPVTESMVLRLFVKHTLTHDRSLFSKFIPFPVVQTIH